MPFKNPHPLYSVWRAMRNRCYKPGYRQYADYGGRGIRVCDRWIEPRNGFQNFVDDLGPRPPGLTLDRIDCNGNYERENCRWADRKTQQRNQRVTIRLVIEGVEYVACELAERFNLKTDTIVERARRGLTFAEVTDRKRRVYTAGLALGGIANGMRNKSKTHCRHGHEFTHENTYLPATGGRVCRKCRAIRQMNRKAFRLATDRITE